VTIIDKLTCLLCYCIYVWDLKFILRVFLSFYW